MMRTMRSKPAGARFLSVSIAVFGLLCANVSQADSVAGNIRDFTRERVEVGMRSAYVQLYEPRRRDYDRQGEFTGGFLGSIDKLSEKQNLMPTPFVRVTFNDAVGLQIGYASLAAKTATYYGHSDGTIELDGPTFELYCRYRMPSGLIPYGAFGLAPLRANFKHDGLWHHGFSPGDPEAYDNWVADGKPAWPNGGYRRTIKLSNATAWMLSAGCAYALNENWSVDVGLRHMAVDVDANYYLSRYGENRQDRGSYTFPMSNGSLLMSMAYDF
jgi:opacity protein-like surface antigen